MFYQKTIDLWIINSLIHLYSAPILPIIDDKSAIICQQVNIFLWNFATLYRKGRNVKSENFKLLAWVKKKLLKKIRQGGVNLPTLLPPIHKRVKLIVLSPHVNNWMYFIKGRGHFIYGFFIGIKNILILLLRSMKLYTLMLRPIISQKLTLVVFRSFFCE